MRDRENGKGREKFPKREVQAAAGSQSRSFPRMRRNTSESVVETRQVHEGKALKGELALRPETTRMKDALDSVARAASRKILKTT
ncbi:hypothetical protein MRX96_011132 [Rhipicephalus microplus]